MRIECYPVGPLETNCYRLSCEHTGESVLIDPGGVPGMLSSAANIPPIRLILLTHGHFDHIGGAKEISELTGAKIAIHRSDAPLLHDGFINGSSLFGLKIDPVKPDMLLEGGERIDFGMCSLTVIPSPGHTKGGVSYFSGRDGVVFSGDTLFRLSIGRWDLPGGDYRTLVRSVREVFVPMPDATTVYPGHGETTTIGFERMYNEFMAEDR